MTKKQKEEQQQLLKEKVDLERVINKIILSAMGYDIDQQGYIIDQDNFQMVKYKKKNLKFFYNDSQIIPAHHSNDMIFNPLSDRGLAEKLFTTFLSKEHDENGLYVKMYYPVQVGNKTIIEVIIDNLGTIQSEQYFNISFSYIELILSMSGSNLEGALNVLNRLEEIYNYDLQ